MIKVNYQLTNGSNKILEGFLHEPSEAMPSRKTRPAILIFPGGGYEYCSDRENEPVVSVFFAKGFQVFVLKYSVMEEALNMQPLKDAAAAMLAIRENALQWNVYSNKIAVCGFSAGGHLAGSIGVLAKRPELLEQLNTSMEEILPNALVLSYPVISSGEYAHRGSFKNLSGFDYEESISRSYSLENYVDETTPPTFIWHTVEDGAVPVENAIMFIQALRKHHIPFECHLFEKGGHGMSVCNQEVDCVNPHCAHWIDLCTEWLCDRFDFMV